MRLFFCLLCAVAALCCLAPPAMAQHSIGFAQPDSVENLLDYRLPDWGYRTWATDFSFSGAGRDLRRDEDRDYSNRVNSRLGSNYFRFRESERWTWQLNAFLNGSYSHQDETYPGYNLSGHSLTGSAAIAGEANRYLGDGPVFLVGSLAESGSYLEYITTRTDTGGAEEIRRFERNARHEYTVGAGWGRVRGVIPLIRAQRLSERLANLGRAPLSSQAVQQVARFLAAKSGYSQVFDRPDRFFWQDVLQPLLREATPLTPYEIFYLTDVLYEDVGQRFEGWQADTRLHFRQDNGEILGDQFINRGRGFVLGLTWYRNLSLNHQVKAGASWGYDWLDPASMWAAPGAGEQEESNLRLELGHLWCLADRHLWQTSLRYSSVNGVGRDYLGQYLNLSSRLTTYIENHLSLETTVLVSRAMQDSQDTETRGWQWMYSLGLAYHLDRLLF